jgi:hypothetical protein
MEDLQQMVPETVEVTVGGKTLSIGPIRIRQVSRVARHVGGLVRFFAGDAIDFEGLLTEGAEDLMEALAAATDQPVEWVGELDLDEVVRLTRTVIEVNADFFVRTVLPEVEKAQGALSGLNQTGRTSSNA